MSDTDLIINRVPQGSVLGSLLFSYTLMIFTLALIHLTSTSLLMILTYYMLTTI